ncbi:MAG TPA: hypothetical protein P5081_03815 [Phycisphaerae bacterium]|nr:hypothetical protein [Phycisphaerae bacterium]HRW51986.1 hypothetical protein [Phycisphaerae bacterium]
MRQLSILCALLAVAPMACSSSSDAGSKSSGPKADFTTPEGAILKLEEAYRKGDLEAAVACKDFHLEAEYMLRYEMATKWTQGDQLNELILSTAEILELAYRAEMAKSGLPDFEGIRSTFPKKEKVTDDIYRVTEVCTFPDGGTSEQDLLVGRRNGEWKVLHVAEPS